MLFAQFLLRHQASGSPMPSWLARVGLLALLLFQLTSASPTAKSPSRSTDNWDDVPASSNHITWTPCFEEFQCTRLIVPLDWQDPSLGTTKVAFMKYPSHNATAQNLLLNFGGPGGSGIGTLKAAAPSLAEIYGPTVHLVTFDPRGVNNTGPSLDCFPGDPTTRNNFEATYFRSVADGGSDALATQFAMADAFGRWCNGVLGGPVGAARYVNTPAVARDLLAFVEAAAVSTGGTPRDARLWYAGYSYGTVLGTTFAAMYPERVGRMILDGVEDGRDYYEGRWSNNLVDADAGVDSFVEYCFEAGARGCAFWDESPQRIEMRLSGVLTRIKEVPIPVWNSTVVGMPVLATYSDLKNVLLKALYFPLASFPILARVLKDLEQGSGDSLMAATGLTFGYDIPQNREYDSSQANAIIQCVDAGGRTNMTSLAQYRDYAEYLMRQSKYVGDAWSINALNCRTLDVIPPPSGQFGGSLPPSAEKTSFPLLFIGNQKDPVTPLANAYKMSSYFPYSTVLALDAPGHCSLSAPSNCTNQHVQAYLAGLPLPTNISCKPNEVPFKSKLEGLAAISEILGS